MKRRHPLQLEELEGRALLSGLLSSLTTDHAVYQAGQPIQMTFTETNPTRQPIPIAVGPSVDGFSVSQHGQAIWRSNAGIVPMYLVDKTLQPGESFTLTAIWNGIPNTGDGSNASVDTGTFVVSNELDPTGARATFQVVAARPQPTPAPDPPAPNPIPTPTVPNPIPPTPGPNPVTPAPTPSPITPPVSIALTTDHPTDRPGHPIRIRVILTDVGDSPVSLTPEMLAQGLTVSQGSRVVWRLKPRGHNLSVQALQPGRSVALTTVWNGRPNQPGLAKLTPGTYTIQMTTAGHIASAPIHII